MDVDLPFILVTLDLITRAQLSQDVRRLVNFVTINEVVGRLILVTFNSNDPFNLVFFPSDVNGLTDIMAGFHLSY